ncbi:dCTP deaminase domain-containing protein [Massilia sp. CT11-108]|uniref:dCTP deaminase domain-containing protein n=1 Tax=Massilia sp. CT11-108 TaxID=3393900 RepID=UPI0039A58836
MNTTFTLEPRGVVWVISQEDFHLASDTTAVAALRTTWAHKGIFALNVGVVDPGWKGPVATALVNFSTEDFKVSPGDPFMRLMFFEHLPTQATLIPETRDEYVKKIKKNSRNLSDSFLNMNSLVDDVARKIFNAPKIAVVATWAGVLIAVLAIFVPMAVSVWTGVYDDRIAVAKLQQRVEQLEKEQSSRTSETKLDKLNDKTEDKQASGRGASAKESVNGTTAPVSP